MGSKSSSKSSTEQTYYDNRQVNDAAGGVIGTGNTQDQSIRLTDSRSTNYSDSSRKSYADNSRVSTTTNNTTTDQGAVKAAVSMTEKAMNTAGELGSQSLTLGRGAISGAYKSSADALDFGRDLFGDVIGLARNVVDQAGTQASAAGDIARGAYTDSTDASSGNRTLMYVAIGAVGLVGMAVAFGLLRK